MRHASCLLAAMTTAVSAGPDTCPATNKSVVEAQKAILREDFDLAMKLVEPGCAKGDGNACYMFAGLANRGRGTAVDEKRANALFAKAGPLLESSCKAGCTDACVTLGWTFHTGQGNRTIDNKHARELLDKSCTLKSGEGCFLLSQFYSFGYGVTVDRDRSNKLARTSCDLAYALGCNSVAYDYETGKGGVKDPSKAKDFHTRACKLGLLESCKAVNLPLPK
jgi:uncharacterized protein